MTREWKNFLGIAREFGDDNLIAAASCDHSVVWCCGGDRHLVR